MHAVDARGPIVSVLHAPLSVHVQSPAAITYKHLLQRYEILLVSRNGHKSSVTGTIPKPAMNFDLLVSNKLFAVFKTCGRTVPILNVRRNHPPKTTVYYAFSLQNTLSDSHQPRGKPPTMLAGAC